jgi:hypothetical protein
MRPPSNHQGFITSLYPGENFMKAFQNKTLTRWSLALAAALMLASCGGSDNDTDSATGTSGVGPGTGTTTTGSNQPGTTNTASVALPSNAFASNLTGAEEVPPVTTSATGTGVVVVDPSTMQMKATVITRGITATAAHIHIAPRGQSGPIVFPLAETSGGSGIWTTEATLTTTQMNDLRAGNYYFNVHSAAFPNGEIRGQILQGASTGSSGTTSTGTTGTGTTGTGTTGTGTAGTGTTGTSTTGTGTAGTTTTGGGDAGTTGTGTVSTTAPTSFINVLTGAQQVPANASTGVAIAVAIFDPATRTLKSSITTMGISGTDAHIHQGASGSAGPVIFPMTETAPGSGIWVTNALLNDEGVSSLTAGTFYFDVHSAAYADGELRAQILPQPSSDGTGGTGTGTTSTGTTSTGTTSTGTTGTGTTGTETTGTGTTGTGTTGTGTTGTGTTGTGTTGTGTTGTGTTGTGTTGTGTTGTGTTGTGTTGTGTTGTGTTGTGTTGSGSTTGTTTTSTGTTGV